MYITHDHSDNRKRTESEPCQLSLIYDTMLRPFIEPFLDITIQTLPKLILGAVVLLFMIVGTIQDLLQTPKPLWIGLMLLAGLDFLAGTFRAIFDKDVKFSIHRWARSAYKFTTYTIVIGSTAVSGNMYPEIFGWVQYVVIAMLVALELFSIARHMKMTAFVYAIINMAQTSGSTSGKAFADMVEEMDRKIQAKKRQHTYRKDRVEEPE